MTSLLALATATIFLAMLFLVNDAYYQYPMPDRDPYEPCYKCICQKQSQCRALPCRNGMCGYFQITKAFYIDAGTPQKRSRESIETAWKRCAGNYKCSKQCLYNFAVDHHRNCPARQTVCEVLSRLANGGPRGCTNRNTLPYWNAIKRCYQG